MSRICRDLNFTMKFNEVLDLLKAVSAFHADSNGETPKLCVYDTQDLTEGYVLCIHKNSNNGMFLNFLESVAERRKLGIREFNGHLVLYSLTYS
jgi:hypothetical protein